MKILFYSVCSLGFPHMGVILERVLEEKNKGNEVFFAYCNNALSSCDFNTKGNTGYCKICQLMYKEIIKKHLDGVHIIPIKKADCRHVHFDYSSFSELREIKYRDVCIGMSIMSFYIIHTRDMDSPVTNELRAYFDKLLDELRAFVDATYDLIEGISPDVISIYNGRVYDNRLFYDISIAKNIPFESMEVVGGPLWHEDKYYRTQFDGGLPHNIHNYQMQIDKVWNDSSRTSKEKIELGSSFYYKRRTGQPAADIIFTKNMVENLLPDDYDKNKKNIVVFNSSDDEKAALGGEWDEGKLFPTQYDAIEFVAKNAPQNAHVYLRIHPNLSNIPYKYHTDLYKLKKYPNLTIIEPTSPISSYALMDIADQVIVFGSAMGVEGCFWGKPVLLLWKSLYYELDTCYVPRTHDELIQMLHADLEPKPKENAIKYGLFNLDRNVRVLKDDYININQIKQKILWRRVDTIDYLRICGSRRLYLILRKTLFAYLMKLSRNKQPIPTKLIKGTRSAT